MTHATLVALPVVDASGWAVAPAPVDELSEELVHAAALGRRHLPIAVDDALLRFAVTPPRSGALLIRNAPIGGLPPTPPTPETPVAKDLSTELTLLTVARRLGQPVGYVPEHGGRIVQNIVPTPSAADSQMSTSSRSSLMFHTETAFHPHRPRYLLLLCLRGDPSAHTTLASVHDIMDRLADDVVDVMFQPRFRTAVDASFLAGRPNELGPARPLVTGTRSEPTFVFDADLTVGHRHDRRRRADRRSFCDRRRRDLGGPRTRRSAGGRQQRRRARSLAVRCPLRRHRPLVAAFVRGRRSRTECRRPRRSRDHHRVRPALTPSSQRERQRRSSAMSLTTELGLR